MKASDEDYPEVFLLQTVLCLLVNRHMHPEVDLPDAEAEAMKVRVLEDLRVMLED